MENKVLCFFINQYHFLWALLGAIFFGFLSCLHRCFNKRAKKIKIIGVTGTSGKSTVIDLTGNILEEAGYRVATLSSIKFKIGNQEQKNKMRMTMPGRAVIQRFLWQAMRAGCEYAILEITSEGILQHRHRFIDFNAAVFTNLSPEHIERHGSFENYREAKARFFRAVKKTHIINLDDKNADYFLQFSAGRKYLYNLKSESSIANGEITAEGAAVSSSGVSFSVRGVKFNLKLLGRFNIYNALAAICVGLSQGIDLETCKKGLEKIRGVSGRMELIISKPFRIFVDYAITPNALEQVYQTIRQNFLSMDSLNAQGGKMICVFGSCGGGRDKWKRPVIGRLAAQYCDKVILTNEDPYGEDPEQILLEIKSGIPNEKMPIVSLILDRRAAIKKALDLARENDTVIITGKGCEPSMCLAKGKQIAWDDRQVVREEFEKLTKR